MHVIATAGHVDHGKSTLVRALTGMEPDRLAEERRRAMTIDLGYAWVQLPTGETLAFVDVPGHQRFIGNMLAGLGPAPAVLFVVAADSGWQRQSAEHLAAIDALGLQHGLLAVTRSDLADPAGAIATARRHLAASSLGTVSAVAVSGTTGSGLAALREELHEVVHALPEPRRDGRVRLWIDRAFSIRGSGTVVTGTLGEGTIAVDQTLELNDRPAKVRSLQCLGRAESKVTATARVAVNLRAVALETVHRGDALLTPGAWRRTALVDVRLTTTGHRVPAEVQLHIGSASTPVHVRPLSASHARLTLSKPLPLEIGDRAILRDAGQQAIVAAVLVLDPKPPSLERRGDARRRADDLAQATGRPDLAGEVQRRGTVTAADLERLGVRITATPGVRNYDGWLVSAQVWEQWVEQLPVIINRHTVGSPLAAPMTTHEARLALQIPALSLLRRVAADAGLEEKGGALFRPGVAVGMGDAERSVRLVEDLLGSEPFASPDRGMLSSLGLGSRELAAADRAGRLLRIGDNIVLPPTAPILAAAILGRLPQPFSPGDARHALGTTRRVAIPLLEHLDAIGITRRTGGGLREVVHRKSGTNHLSAP